MTGPRDAESLGLGEKVSTSGAPAALGPYAQAQRIRTGDSEWLYTSGQVGLDPTSGELVSGGTGEETRRVLANLRAVVHAAGFGFEHVVKTTIYLADLSDFQIVNQIYAEAMAGHLAARSTVQVAGLPKGARVEIDLVCVRHARGTDS
jgi:2-iminobutanoate/2-iminopropanoate deaminase